MLERMSIFTKISIGLAVMLLLLFVTSTNSFIAQSRTNHVVSSYQRALKNVELISEVHLLVEQSSKLVDDVLVAGNPEAIYSSYKELRKTIDSKSAELDQALRSAEADQLLANIKQDLAVADLRAREIFKMPSNMRNQKNASQAVKSFNAAINKASNDVNELHKLITKQSTGLSDQISKTQKRAGTTNWLIIALSIIVFGAVTIALKRQVIDPSRNAFRKISESAKSLLDSSQRVALNSEQIKNANTEIVNSMSVFSRTSEEQANSVLEVNQLAGQISTAINQVASGAQEQARDVSEAHRMMEQLSSAVSEVVENATTVARVASASLGTAEMGKDSVDKAVSGMSAMRETVLSTANKIQALGEKSKQIGEII
ncbi:MAG: methyl-accepting chemotaxis protein, partial [Actinomycetota bacterium]|nr:methyl-accepting chemotaxis protein [Actinomycetota bacterium]